MDPRDPRYNNRRDTNTANNSASVVGGAGMIPPSSSSDGTSRGYGGVGRGVSGYQYPPYHVGGHHPHHHGGRKAFGRGGGYPHASNGSNGNANNHVNVGGLPSSSAAAQQKERDMMSIYGRGEDHSSVVIAATNGGGNHAASLAPQSLQPPSQPRKFHHNPCRFAGHDHEWKDCPNNFRNKKKNSSHCHPLNSLSGGGGTTNNIADLNNNNNNGVGGGHHYGPASSSSFELGGGAVSGGMIIMDRPSIVGSRSQSSDFYGSGGGSSGGDRGYTTTTTSNNNDHHRQPSSLGQRSQSFGDNLLRSGGSNSGDRRRNSNLFSPHGGGGGGGGDTNNPRPSPMSSSSRGYSTSYTPSSDYRKRPHFNEDIISDVPMPTITSSTGGGGVGSGGGGGGGQDVWSSSPETPHSRISGGGIGGSGDGFRGSGRHLQTPHHYQQQQQQHHRGSFSKSPGEIRPSPYNKSPGEIRSDMQYEGGGGGGGGSFSSTKSPSDIRPSPYAKSPGEIRLDMQNENYHHRGGSFSSSKSPGEIRQRTSLESPRNSFARQDSFGSSPRHSREVYHSRSVSGGDISFHSYATTSYSREEGEEAEAKTEEGHPNEKVTKGPSSPLKEEQPSLTCSALKDEEKIRKAEDIICRMAKIMDNLSASVPSNDGLTPLPTKIEITKCMAMLEKKIKAKGKEATTTKKEVREMEEQEKQERMRKEMEKVKEEERKAQEELDRRRRIEKEFEDRINERNQAVEDKRDELMQVFNARKHEFNKRRQSGRTKLQNECQAAIEEKVGGIKSEIFAIREKVKEAERTIQALDEIAFQEADAAMPDMIDEDESDMIPTMDAPGKMSSLISRILAQNQRTASEAHHDSLSAIPYFPKGDQGGETVSNEEWSNRARKVTGIHNALFLEPKDLPMFEENNRTFLELAPLMKECIHDKHLMLKSRWEDLANQYVTRQAIYKEETGVDLESSGGYFSAVKPIEIEEPAPRGNNPYRRARRGISPGDVVRSEYEQEQIIAEIAAKEAMEKRIKEGGCALPRQQCLLERQLFSSYSNSFFSQRVDDMLADEEERRHINIWTDMEKCIFLDRFLHHPKDFRKIATFLRNKTTKDCIKFYYDSKKTVPYKHALKEFLLRKKRRGDVVPWDATIQSALSVGASVKAGSSAEKPLEMSIPDNDCTYHTISFHPMKLEVFNKLEESVLHAKHLDDAKKENHKSRRSNWFILDSGSRKFLKHHEKHHEKEHHHKRKAAALSDEEQEPKKVQRKNEMASVHHEDYPQERKHKPQKWKAEEKRLLYEALEKYGHDWPAISKVVGTRTDIQAKNYFHDNKEKITKQLNERAGNGKDEDGVKIKKKPGRKKKVIAPLPHPADSASASGPPPFPADVVREVATKRDSVDSSVSNPTSEQEEQYRQQVMLQQQQDHIRHQNHLLQQQQHIHRLVQQKRQEEMYRQHQEEIYRQQVHHLRQQEIFHAHAHAQQLQQQQNRFHEQMGQHNYEQHQLQNLQQLLAIRGRQSPYYQGGNGGGGDLDRIFQAAAAAGIPQSALEAVMANSNGQQHQGQQQALNMELLRRIAQQQQRQRQGDNNPYYGHGYGNEYQR